MSNDYDFSALGLFWSKLNHRPIPAIRTLDTLKGWITQGTSQATQCIAHVPTVPATPQIIQKSGLGEIKDLSSTQVESP